MNEKNTTAIAEYSPTAAALADIASRMAKVVYDVSTPAGMAAAKKDRAEVRDLRVALEKKRKEIKEPALTRCREIDTEAARITTELLKYETPPDDAIKAAERAIEAERLAKVAAEEKRQREIQVRITAMRDAITDGSLCKSAAQVSEVMVEIEDGYVIDESYAEFRDTAAAVKSEVLAKLDEMLKVHVEREKEDQRLREERAELARQRAEQDARDKVERDRVAAETAAANKKLADERAAFEADKAADREKERKRQAEIDAENARIAAEQREAQDRIAADLRVLEARQQAERDAQAKKERDEKEAREIEERRAVAEAEEQRRKNFKPTFDEIVGVIAQHYQRDFLTARGWVLTALEVEQAA